mgnify:CR=1 FL=1|tara:strand:+ start:343 stop:876 length:534 start_codon:yes stop_codon:yes gene_type:complete
MFDKEAVEEVIERFKNLVIEEAKGNLQRQNKDASGKLRNSITGETKVMKNSIRLTFDMLPYGWFQDLGVNGRRTARNDTPFSYTTKKPPARALEKWIKQRGIQGRDKKTGRFITHKSLSYLIAQSIFRDGIKASLFFTTPFKKHFKELGKEVQNKYGLSIEKLFKDIMEERLKNFKN